MATNSAPEHTLWEGTLDGKDTEMPLFMADGRGHSVQMILAASHPMTDLTEGPLAGCQFVRHAGKTDVLCPTASLRHYRIETVSMDEVEAGVARAKANPAF